MLHKYYVTTCALYEINNRLPTKPVLNYSTKPTYIYGTVRLQVFFMHRPFSMASFRRRSKFPVEKDDRPFLTLYFIKLEGGKKIMENICEDGKIIWFLINCFLSGYAELTWRIVSKKYYREQTIRQTLILIGSVN